ncbi:hypothetical protein Nm8I071_23170 [Nonomuraea sp. TT08I-71]|nr:hypothetical protein Nm8I071_23170 [Nonomuraea sp. TT08I-71]
MRIIAARALIEETNLTVETIAARAALSSAVNPAGVPDDIGFAPKPALARQMIAAALDAGVPFAWVTGDGVYGADPRLRADLEHHGIGYVLAVGCDRRVAVNGGRTLVGVNEVADRSPPPSGNCTAAEAGRKVPASTCGPGSRPPPALVSTDGCFSAATAAPVSRPSTCAGHPARSRCTPSSPSLDLAEASRSLSKPAKARSALNHYQVRGWTGWHRHVTLAVLALAVLTILAAQQPDTDSEITALTIAEIRRLFNAFVLAGSLPPTHALHWSIWRLTSQARARRSHYQRRQAKLTLE